MDDGPSLDSASVSTLGGKSGRGLPQSKTLRDYRGRWEVRQVLDWASPRGFSPTGAAGKSVRFWTAPVLWRFGRAGEMKWTTDQAWIQPQSARSGGKAVEGYHSPRRC